MKTKQKQNRRNVNLRLWNSPGCVIYGMLKPSESTKVASPF